jgi:hypothetical protein
MVAMAARQWSAIGGLLLMVVAGCDNPAEPTSGGGGGGGGGGRQPAPGNPARIFAPDREGLPYYLVADDIKRDLVEACGDGTLCVDITLAEDEDQRDERHCVFHRAEPDEIGAGETFTFYLSDLDCDPPTESSEPDESPDSGDSSGSDSSGSGSDSSGSDSSGSAVSSFEPTG